MIHDTLLSFLIVYLLYPKDKNIGHQGQSYLWVCDIEYYMYPIFCLFFSFESNYRVSHSKEVIMLWWGYRFWFLLIFWILHVHQKDTFMLNSSVFIFLMLCALYRMICKNLKLFLGENSMNVTNVKLLSKKFFCRILGNFHAFLFSTIYLKKKCTFLMVWYFLLLEKGS